MKAHFPDAVIMRPADMWGDEDRYVSYWATHCKCSIIVYVSYWATHCKCSITVYVSYLVLTVSVVLLCMLVTRYIL